MSYFMSISSVIHAIQQNFVTILIFSKNQSQNAIHYFFDCILLIGPMKFCVSQFGIKKVQNLIKKILCINLKRNQDIFRQFSVGEKNLEIKNFVPKIEYQSFLFSAFPNLSLWPLTPLWVNIHSKA